MYDNFVETNKQTNKHREWEKFVNFSHHCFCGNRKTEICRKQRTEYHHLMMTMVVVVNFPGIRMGEKRSEWEISLGIFPETHTEIFLFS